MKRLLIFTTLFLSIICKAQSYCTPTTAPLISYPPNTTNLGQAPQIAQTHPIQYLCGPNTIVYDTIGPARSWSVYVDSYSTLNLKPSSVSYQEIWLKSTSTLNLTNGSSTLYVYAETGAIINQPSVPHIYTLALLTCPSISYPFINCATGLVENNTELNVKISPNPTNSIINITDEQNQFKNSSITIADHLGQIVLTVPFSNQIDIGSLTSGMYFLILQNKTNKKTVKIIKQ